ncbi:Mismatch repair protein msh3 [Thoreauomyces humboldtii]|nr:Mismatch repair protein msh3 [Thoreauomyces humboldtii]
MTVEPNDMAPEKRKGENPQKGSVAGSKKQKTANLTSKQPTISSFFFAPKPTPNAAPLPGKPPTPLTSNPVTPTKTGDGDRIPEASEHVLPATSSPTVTDSPATPARGRIRRRPLIASDDEDEDEDENTTMSTLPALQPDPAMSMIVDPPAQKTQSRRTESFRFDPKNVRPTSGDENVSQETPERVRLRNRFLQKFTIDERSSHGEAVQDLVHEVSEPEEDVEAEKPKRIIGRPMPKKAPVKPKKSPYTPLEQQFLEIKATATDCLLFIEVGYKFRLFGDDAKVAAKELNIVAYKDHAMYTAGIPTHRLHVHVQKLVQLGYKVGVVRQMETAALKAAGDNKSAPFVRKLTNIYTKGTFIDDLEADTGAFEIQSSYLMCISEEANKANPEKPNFSIVHQAIQLHTGDVIFDSFEDNHMRNELETRMMHIQPTEIILPDAPLSDVTEKLIRHLCENFGATGDGVRIERLKDAFLDHSDARKALAAFYEKPLVDEGLRQEDGTILGAEIYSQALSLPRPIVVCLAALLTYLVQFGLEGVLRLTKFFAPFASMAHMVLNANTLSSLEIYRNETDYSERGSLLSILDHTKTKFGRRLLRKWIGKPLVQKAELQDRIDAVEELMKEDADENVLVRRIKGLVCQLPERTVARIHYGRCAPSELYNVLFAFEKITMSVPVNAAARFRGAVLKKIYASLPTMKKAIETFLGMINEEAAKSNDKLELFTDTSQWPEISEHRNAILDVERELQEYLKEMRKATKRPTLSYATVSGIEYLVEIPAGQASKVPANWIKISSTKAYSRFHSPFVVEKIKERDRARESLTAACETAFRDFVKTIADQYEQLREVVLNMATMDCLFSLATVANQPGYCKPQFVADSTITVKEGRNPIAETLTPSYQANDIDLSHDQRCLLITGPNMGGKSSFVRQVALIVIMAQIGSYVPAESAYLGIFDSVHTRMGASDDLAGGQSTFMKELQETSDIMRVATPRSLVILDELGRGTSTHDGTAIAFATLRHFIESIRCLTLFVTHYPVLGQLEREFPGALRNCHMAFHETDEPGDADHTIVFLYTLTSGLAHKSYGMNVARLANLPKPLLDLAQSKANELEMETEARKLEKKRYDNFAMFRRLANEARTLTLEDLTLVRDTVRSEEDGGRTKPATEEEGGAREQVFPRRPPLDLTVPVTKVVLST